VTLASADAELVQALGGAEVVFHLAGIAHDRVSGAAEGELHRVNAECPARILAAAEAGGVPAMIWLSSIKVLGDTSERPFRPEDAYRAGDAYARSKVAGERALLDRESSTRTAIVRPPLVYGPGVAGNFSSLVRWVGSGVPLPLGAASAPRSMVGVDNLCSLLLRLADQGSGVFHVADSRDRSVAELIRTMAVLMGVPDRSWRVSPRLLAGIASAFGQRARYTRLFEPLQVDQSMTRERLGWQPPHDPDHQLEATLRWFRERRQAT
jgi:nucleoside-diphosphate-sugar epimerase